MLWISRVMRTGKSMSETLILESVNPQYDERLFIEFQEKYKFTTCCVQKFFFCFCFDIPNNICTQHVVKLYFSWNSMNNLLSYCGINWCKNEGFWKRFTCKSSHFIRPLNVEISVMNWIFVFFLVFSFSCNQNWI